MSMLPVPSCAGLSSVVLLSGTNAPGWALFRMGLDGRLNAGSVAGDPGAEILLATDEARDTASHKNMSPTLLLCPRRMVTLPWHFFSLVSIQ
jgi:hypothetical protein